MVRHIDNVTTPTSCGHDPGSGRGFPLKTSQLRRRRRRQRRRPPISRPRKSAPPRAGSAGRVPRSLDPAAPCAVPASRLRREEGPHGPRIEPFTRRSPSFAPSCFARPDKVRARRDGSRLEAALVRAEAEVSGSASGGDPASSNLKPKWPRYCGSPGSIPDFG